MFSRKSALSDEGPVIAAIGDIHGRADLLNKLLKRLDKKLEGRVRQTVFLGDYVDRGKESRDVLNMLLAYQDRYPETVFLKGNHEQAMLDFLADPHENVPWLEWGGEETLASYGVDTGLPRDLEVMQAQLAELLPESHFQFLMNLSLRWEAGPYVFVHAGLDPERAIEDQDETDLLWIREPFLDKGEGAFPGKVVVHGHTPSKKLENLSWRINVDTGAYWTGKLTAVLLDTEGNRIFVSS